MSDLLNNHPYFDSYTKKTNVVSKNQKQDNFFEIFSNLGVVDKEKLLKGENLDIITELESYSGNVSTSQLKNIDYSKFSNHVFFDSAVHKVKYAFDEIIKYPYDANESEYLTYITNLDGYTKHVLENIYPKYKGHIDFNGDSKVVIKDKKGALLNDFSKKEIIEGSLSIINMTGVKEDDDAGFTFSFHVQTPTAASLAENDTQTIFKKIKAGDNIAEEGYFCYIKDDTDQCTLNFGIKTKDAADPFIKSVSLDKNEKYYVNIITKRSDNNEFEIDYYIDSYLTDSNVVQGTATFTYQEFSEDFSKKDIEFIAGSGESNQINIGESSITLGNYSSKLDELIIFNKVRSETDIRYFQNTNVFRENSILLYLKFNEIGGDHLNSALIIDASGNKLHGILKTTADAIITDTATYKVDDTNTPTFLLMEDINKNPIILGSVLSIQSKRDEQVALATAYDAGNSNIIFNLLPTHYFTNSSNFERKADFINGDFNDENSGNTLGKQGSVENTHMTQICLIWARFFDQLKLYVDALSGIFDLDYDSVNREDFVNSQMKLLCKIYGFDFVEIDENRTRNKNEKRNILFDDAFESIGLVKLQNLIWKKILINSQDIIRSKGTINSINSFINSLGFDLKKYMYIEEKSYKNYINLEDSFEVNTQEIKSLNYSKFKDNDISYDVSGIVQNKPVLEIKDIKFVNSSNNPAATSGFNNDYSVELFFDLNKNIYKNFLIKNENPYKTKQIISQFVGSSSDICWGILYFNFKNNKSKMCDLIFKYSLKNLGLSQVRERTKEIKIENINAYDAPHYVSITSSKSDNNEIEMKLSYQTIGDVTDSNMLLSTVATHSDMSGTLWQNNSNLDIKIGNIKYDNIDDTQIFNNGILNDTSFEGSLYNIKIWKKTLSDKEMIRHAQDIMNISEDDFIVDNKSNLVSNFYFNDVDYQLANTNDIDIIASNYYSSFVDKDAAGNDLNTCNIKINFNEVEQEDCFSIGKLIRKTKSGNIDKIDSNNFNRVRILSYESEDNRKSYDNYELYPVHDMPIDYENYNTDFMALSVSSAKTVNDAIERLMTNIEKITDIVTANMQIYEYSYIDIDQLRNSFFENFDDNEHIDYDNLNNIFKYFDNIMNNVLFSMIPNGITFKGFNLVYESHVLERSKYQYKNKDSNIPIQDSADFSQTKFDPCKFIHKRSKAYNNNRRFES